MNPCRTIFYRPEPEYVGMQHGEDCGDFMPFYWKGTYYLFYLYKYCIYVVETKDFVHFGEPYLVLACGTPDDQDWYIGTGSCFFHNGIFYFYYTGFNESNRGKPGKHEQVIMRALSTDLKTWEKDPEFRSYPDEALFGHVHWRDPQIFWNPEIKKFCMAITAADKNGMKNRSGCSVVMISDDVEHWEPYHIIYSPHIYTSHECQDLFKIGDWWYLIFSTYTRWWESHYRMAESMDGPWITPNPDDMLDGRLLYAAKTVTDNNRRYLVGWQSARKDCDDSNPNLWGGSLLVHELVQRRDGTLGVKPVEQVERFLSKPMTLSPVPRQGQWVQDESFTSSSPDAFSWMELGALRELCMVKTTVEWEEDTVACGLMLHTEGENLEKWCQVRLEVGCGQLVIDRFNRFNGDQSFIDERPIVYHKNRADIKVIMSGNIIVTYVDDVAIAVRSYSTGIGGFGIFVEGGSASFMNTGAYENI